MIICRHPDSRMRRAFGDDAGPFCVSCWSREASYIDGLRLDQARAEDGLPLITEPRESEGDDPEDPDE